MTTPRAEELREAYLAVVPERFDVQFCLHDLGTYTGEEVNVYSIRGKSDVRFVPLPTRRAGYQLNWRAVDENGSNLVLLSKLELSEIYAELFEDAVTYLRGRRDLPSSIKQLIAKPDWKQPLFNDSWVKSLTRNDVEELSAFFKATFARYPQPPGPRQAATIMFAEYVIGRLQGWYRPWVQLSRAIPPSPGIEPKVLVKYESDERIATTFIDRISGALLGWMNLVAILPVSQNASTHQRVRPPSGMVLRRPTNEQPVSKPGAWMPQQLQYYHEDPTGGSEAPDNQLVTVKVTQNSAMRILVSAFFAILGFLPALSTWVAFLLNPTETKYVVEWHVSWAGFFNVLSLVTPSHLVLASGLSLPLALALLASAWDRPPVRAFVITQFVLSLLLVVAWLLAALVPPMGMVALLTGAALSSFNAVEWVMQEWARKG